MRILIATTYRGVVGGAECYLRSLLPALRERGHELALLYEVAPQPTDATIDEGCSGTPAWSLVLPEGLAAVARWRPDVCYLQGVPRPEVEEHLISRLPTVFF